MRLLVYPSIGHLQDPYIHIVNLMANQLEEDVVQCDGMVTGHLWYNGMHGSILRVYFGDF